MSGAQHSSRQHIAEEAAAWFAAIREQTVSAAERKLFADWLAESPVHVQEYLALAETWSALQSAQPWPQHSTEELLGQVAGQTKILSFPAGDAASSATNRNSGEVPGAKAANFSVPTAPTAKKPNDGLAVRRGSSRGRYGRPVVFAAAATIAMLAVLLAWGSVLWFDGNRYVTARGEQRSIVLEDGTVVQMNTLTRVKVRFDARSRRIELPAGEAFFRVAHDKQRPFDVVTPYATVRAVGTEFSVYNRERSTRVAVVEGKVRVMARDDGRSIGAATRSAKVRDTLGAQEAVDVKASGRIERLPSAKSDLAVAWIQRRLVFDSDRVEDAVAEFNRYNQHQMRVVDAALANLRISGVFDADDPGALLKYLERIQKVNVSADEAGVQVLRWQNN